MKTLVLNLTDDQFARIDALAKLLQTKPEHVAVGLALDNADSCESGGWDEWQHVLQSAVEFYGEKRQASTARRGHRFEDGAPDRLIRLALRGASLEVSHV